MVLAVEAVAAAEDAATQTDLANAPSDAGAAGAGAGAEEEEEPVMVFVNEWLGAIVDFDIGLLVVQLLAVPHFSVAGRAQLSVDLEYLK